MRAVLTKLQSAQSWPKAVRLARRKEKEIDFKQQTGSRVLRSQVGCCLANQTKKPARSVVNWE